MYTILVGGIIVYGLAVSFKSALQGNWHSNDKYPTDKTCREMTQHRWFYEFDNETRENIWNMTDEENRITLRDKGILGPGIDDVGI